MINIFVQNNTGYVWNAEDWLTLRHTHRIVTNLIGSLTSFPRQEVVKGLPAILLPEEVTLLHEKNIACIVYCDALEEEPSENIKAKQLSHFTQFHDERVAAFIDERKKEITSIVDQIVEGKRQKWLKKNKSGKVEDINIDRNKIIKQELEKVTRSTSVFQSSILIPTSDPLINNKDVCDQIWLYPSSSKEFIKYKTFKDLWEKGHYITSGSKFGGDFLVYPGDPIKYHSHFIVLCVERDTDLSAKQLVSLGRIGSNTKKTVVLSTLSRYGDAISYQSLQWAESSGS